MDEHIDCHSDCPGYQSLNCHSLGAEHASATFIGMPMNGANRTDLSGPRTSSPPISPQTPSSLLTAIRARSPGSRSSGSSWSSDGRDRMSRPSGRSGRLPTGDRPPPPGGFKKIRPNYTIPVGPGVVMLLGILEIEACDDDSEVALGAEPSRPNATASPGVTISTISTMMSFTTPSQAVNVLSGSTLSFPPTLLSILPAFNNLPSMASGINMPQKSSDQPSLSMAESIKEAQKVVAKTFQQLSPSAPAFFPAAARQTPASLSSSSIPSPSSPSSMSPKGKSKVQASKGDTPELKKMWTKHLEKNKAKGDDHPEKVTPRKAKKVPAGTRFSFHSPPSSTVSPYSSNPIQQEHHFTHPTVQHQYPAHEGRYLETIQEVTDTPAFATHTHASGQEVTTPTTHYFSPKPDDSAYERAYHTGLQKRRASNPNRHANDVAGYPDTSSRAEQLITYSTLTHTGPEMIPPGHPYSSVQPMKYTIKSYRGLSFRAEQPTTHPTVTHSSSEIIPHGPSYNTAQPMKYIVKPYRPSSTASSIQETPSRAQKSIHRKVLTSPLDPDMMAYKHYYTGPFIEQTASLSRPSNISESPEQKAARSRQSSMSWTEGPPTNLDVVTDEHVLSKRAREEYAHRLRRDARSSSLSQQPKSSEKFVNPFYLPKNVPYSGGMKQKARSASSVAQPEVIPSSLTEQELAYPTQQRISSAPLTYPSGIATYYHQPLQMASQHQQQITHSTVSYSPDLIAATNVAQKVVSHSHSHSQRSRSAPTYPPGLPIPSHLVQGVPSKAQHQRAHAASIYPRGASSSSRTRQVRKSKKEDLYPPFFPVGWTYPWYGKYTAPVWPSPISQATRTKPTREELENFMLGAEERDALRQLAHETEMERQRKSRARLDNRNESQVKSRKPPPRADATELEALRQREKERRAAMLGYPTIEGDKARRADFQRSVQRVFPTQYSEQPNSKFPNSHVVAANDQDQRIVSLLESVLSNMALYRDGYANFQPRPHSPDEQPSVGKASTVHSSNGSNSSNEKDSTNSCATDQWYTPQGSMGRSESCSSTVWDTCEESDGEESTIRVDRDARPAGNDQDRQDTEADYEQLQQSAVLSLSDATQSSAPSAAPSLSDHSQPESPPNMQTDEHIPPIEESGLSESYDMLDVPAQPETNSDTEDMTESQDTTLTIPATNTAETVNAPASPIRPTDTEDMAESQSTTYAVSVTDTTETVNAPISPVRPSDPNDGSISPNRVAVTRTTWASMVANSFGRDRTIQDSSTPLHLPLLQPPTPAPVEFPAQPAPTPQMNRAQRRRQNRRRSNGQSGQQTGEQTGGQTGDQFDSQAGMAVGGNHRGQTGWRFRGQLAGTTRGQSGASFRGQQSNAPFYGQQATSPFRGASGSTIHDQSTGSTRGQNESSRGLFSGPVRGQPAELSRGASRGSTRGVSGPSARGSARGSTNTTGRQNSTTDGWSAIDPF